MIKFEWDASKASSNRREHGVTFEEAQSVFYDDFAIQFFDDENSKQEDRFLILGRSNQSRTLLISHCEKSQAISFESYLHVKQQQKSGSSIKVNRNEKRI